MKNKNIKVLSQNELKGIVGGKVVKTAYRAGRYTFWNKIFGKR